MLKEAGTRTQCDIFRNFRSPTLRVLPHVHTEIAPNLLEVTPKLLLTNLG
jgi:hypothetical protein